MKRESKSARINIRCTETQKQKINEKAKKAGLMESEYVIMAAIKSRTRVSTPGKDGGRTLAQLQATGNELRIEILKLEGSADNSALLKMVDELDEGVYEAWRLLRW